MFSKNFQRKYALTDQGLRNVRKGAFWTVIVNLVVMAGMGILYLLMGGFMGTLTEGASLPGPLLFAGLTVLFVVLSFVTHLQQYQATYGLVYNEVKGTRLSLAERLRKLPLGYFGKRDLADLTETIMGDVNRMEHVWSHVLGYLWGAYISTAIIAVCLLVYDWRLTIACLWGVPVAFALLFGARKLTARASERTKAAALRVSDGIQEALENVREIRAANQEARYLEGLNQKIDEHETVTIRGELGTGIFVNAASVIMRLGVATTILVGAQSILAGRIDFMLLLKAFAGGADGIIVSGCHPNDCHYTSGNFHARRRWIVFRGLLDFMGIDVRRIRYSWVSAAEGGKWADLVNDTVREIRELGPYTRYREVADYIEKEENHG